MGTCFGMAQFFQFKFLTNKAYKQVTSKKLKSVNKQTLTITAQSLFILAVVITLLILAKDVLIPLAVSIFFAYLLYPLSWAIERRGVHRILAILLVILLALLVLGSAALFVSLEVSNARIDLTELQQQVDRKADVVQRILEARLGVDTSTMDRYLSKASESFFNSWQSAIGSLFTATTTTIFQLGLLPVYTFFLLFYRTKTAHFIFKLTGRENKRKTLHILREVSQMTTRYMGGLLIVVLILAILNAAGLLLIGVPHALVFGVLAALLNLIPYIGTFLGGLIPILYVLFTMSDPFQMMLKIFILFAIVQFLENNLITPNIVGTNIQINPLAIIISLLVANLIWGIAGMLIAVPCLAIAKIVMRNVEALEPWAYLISDRGVAPYEISFKRIWNKLIKRR